MARTKEERKAWVQTQLRKSISESFKPTAHARDITSAIPSNPDDRKGGEAVTIGTAEARRGEHQDGPVAASRRGQLWTTGSSLGRLNASYLKETH